MPNRLLREGILTSERVNSLGWEAEVFYRRLMSVVDDFGRYTAHPSLLRAALYPLKLDAVRDANMERLLALVEQARLVRVYEVAGKRYLELLDFKQQVRAKESKYPNPPAVDVRVRITCVADDEQVIADAHLDGGGDGVGDVVEVEDENLPTYPPARDASTAAEGTPGREFTASGEPFAMRADWRPSSHFASLAKMSGYGPAANPEVSEGIGEFIAYWLSKPTRKRTQHEWDHALLKSLKADRIRGSPPTTQRTATPRIARDRADGRAAAAAAAFDTPTTQQPEKSIDGIAQRIA